ncbi:hypothetical protein OVA06_03455 [Pseudarthrobacter sp. SL88]|uniref:hypothetical protein n=1 Tax=Pseudarthrobacter sp. SL88 TaxID=2994666 RepID=UPI002274D8A2|nr:hypothetical protein [Pseudarthrobacter sp. SL88]MCY1673781.1 hypothetical protein [Pseudarthrobacter sp. SL88]
MSTSQTAGKTLKVPLFIILAIVAALALGVLLNPLPKPAELAVLDRPATAADTLPEGVSAQQGSGYSVRLAAHDDGIRYFVSGNPDRQNLCVIVVPDNHPNQWSSGCASGANSDREIVRTGSNGIVSAVLVPDGYNTAELEQGGFKKIHKNVYAVRTERVPGSR